MATLFGDTQVQKFHEDGYLLVPNFLPTVDCDLLNAEILNIIQNMDPEVEKRATTFVSGEASMHLLDNYFLTSGDQIRFFFEAEAVDDQGNLKYSRERSLNKIGHALHWLNDEFKKVTFSDKVKEVAKQLKMVNPKIIHSMYIFKPPHIGSEAEPHQDATYLYCEPASSVVGLWIALEDADTVNGCLQFIPKSHVTEPVTRRLIREAVKMTYTGTRIEYDAEKFVPVPARKGDLILIDGRVVHRSAPNKSDRPRPIYTFHLLDEHESEFSKLNWIQPSVRLPFTPLY